MSGDLILRTSCYLSCILSAISLQSTRFDQTLRSAGWVRFSDGRAPSETVNGGSAHEEAVVSGRAGAARATRLDAGN